jgi:RNA 3'-terminal phosphate cyclase (ATP)
MLTMDGSIGEGGGQVLRSSLGLSVVTGTPFRMDKIRAGRSRPGLMRQHLVAVRAAAEICSGVVSGDELGSQTIEFRPGSVRDDGDATYEFAVGGAGSTTLVFETVLMPLLLRRRAKTLLSFEGGTHNPMAPPVDFLARAYLPLLARMGAKVTLTHARYGFYPAGGGAWCAEVHPAASLTGLELTLRGAVRTTSATAIVSQLPASIASRELEVLAARLGWDRAVCRPTVLASGQGPGNVVVATVESEHVVEVFTGFGERGVRAETVAEGVANEVARYLAAGVPVGEHLCDQLLLPMALGAGGALRTTTPTEHSRTHAAVLEIFLGTRVTFREDAGGWLVTV